MSKSRFVMKEPPPPRFTDEEQEYRTVTHDHFYNTFNKEPEGQKRLEAACRHTSYLYNRMSEEAWKHKQNLEKLLELMKDPKTTGAALALEVNAMLEEQERLR